MESIIHFSVGVALMWALLGILSKMDDWPKTFIVIALLAWWGVVQLAVDFIKGL